MFTFLLVVHTLIAAALVGVILMQKSEGGGLSGGGNPTGLMSARGAADFLTRTTAVLAALFIGMAILIAAYSTISRRGRDLDETLKRGTPAAPAAPVGAPIGGGAADPAALPVPPAGVAQPAAALPTGSVTEQTPVAPTKPALEKSRTVEAAAPKPLVRKADAPATKQVPAPKQVAPPVAMAPKPATPKPVEAAPAASAPAGDSGATPTP